MLNLGTSRKACCTKFLISRCSNSRCSRLIFEAWPVLYRLYMPSPFIALSNELYRCCFFGDFMDSIVEVLG